MAIIKQATYTKFKYFRGLCEAGPLKLIACSCTKPLAVYFIDGITLEAKYLEFKDYELGYDCIYTPDSSDGYDLRVIASSSETGNAVLISIRNYDNPTDYKITDLGEWFGSSLLRPYFPTGSDFIFCGCARRRIVVYDTFRERISYNFKFGDYDEYTAEGMVISLTETKNHILASLFFASSGMIYSINKRDYNYSQFVFGYSLSDDSCCFGHPSSAEYAIFSTYSTVKENNRLLVFTESKNIITSYVSYLSSFGVFYNAFENCAVLLQNKGEETIFEKIYRVDDSYPRTETIFPLTHLKNISELCFLEDSKNEISASGKVWYAFLWEDPARIIIYEPYKNYYFSPCSQKIYVYTSDSESLKATVDWGDGETDTRSTPFTLTHHYGIRNERAKIVISAGGLYAPYEFFLKECEEELECCLDRLVTIIEVISEGGQGLEDVKVDIFKYNYITGKYPYLRTEYTDSDGFIRALDFVEKDLLLLKASKRGYICSSEKRYCDWCEGGGTVCCKYGTKLEPPARGDALVEKTTLQLLPGEPLEYKIPHTLSLLQPSVGIEYTTPPEPPQELGITASLLLPSVGIEYTAPPEPPPEYALGIGLPLIVAKPELIYRAPFKYKISLADSIVKRNYFYVREVFKLPEDYV